MLPSADQLTAWNPNTLGSIKALALSADGANVVAGGEFSGLAAQPRNNIAAVNATTGVATDWNPNANASVNAVEPPPTPA